MHEVLRIFLKQYLKKQKLKTSTVFRKIQKHRKEHNFVKILNFQSWKPDL